MILGEDGHTQYQPFRLSEEKSKDPNIVWNHLTKSMSITPLIGSNGTRTYQIFARNLVILWMD